MIFLATDSSNGRPVWVHVIAEPVDSARQEIVRRAKAFIQAGGGRELEDFLEYGYHDKTHYVITASRPECKELGPYLDTLLTLRGIEIPSTPSSPEATASREIADERTQEITARLRRAGDSAASSSKLAGTSASVVGHREPPADERTMSSQPTLYIRSDEVRQALESGAAQEQAAASKLPPQSEVSRSANSAEDTEATMRFVRPQFGASVNEAALDPDQTAKVVSPWTTKRVEARPRADAASRPTSIEPPGKSAIRQYPVWEEKARPGSAESSPAQAAGTSATAGPNPTASPAEPVPHQNGSGGHRLVLPPVRRGSPGMPGSLPAGQEPLARVAGRSTNADPKLLYMTLALVMVSLAAIALGLGWYIHSTASVPAQPAATASAAPAGAGTDAPGAAQSSVPAPAQTVPQQPVGAAFSPLLLSIAFISAVLIFAAVVVLFMAVKRGV